ncbi:MAG TPA: sulfotransferase family 2 domain-containing protein [Caulobacterales bacterium]|nr:sulfotransferase family 2 domain-containing protein [Caulobacterales bacterium]
MLERSWPRVLFHLARLAGRRAPRVVFLHIPKCGGSSINYHFKSNYGSQRSGRSVLLDSMEGTAFDAGALGQARRALYVGGHMGFETLEQIAEDAICFSIVREPFSRLRSLYAYSRGITQTNHPGFARLAEMAKRSNFADFCLCDDPDARAMLDNAQARALAGAYYPFRHGDPAETLRAARRNMEALDFVLDMRRLTAAFPCIARRTGTRVVKGKTHANRSPDAGRPEMSRAEFMRVPELRARVALDLELYRGLGERPARNVPSVTAAG